MVKILVAEDDSETRQIVGTTLKFSDFQIIYAGNGKEALDKALSELPDMVILDVMMPDIDGITITRTLRENEKTKDIPIILLTGCGEEEDIQKGLDAGATEYYSKPFSPIKLLDKIHSILKLDGR